MVWCVRCRAAVACFPGEQLSACTHAFVDAGPVVEVLARAVRLPAGVLLNALLARLGGLASVTQGVSRAGNARRSLQHPAHVPGTPAAPSRTAACSSPPPVWDNGAQGGGCQAPHVVVEATKREVWWAARSGSHDTAAC